MMAIEEQKLTINTPSAGGVLLQIIPSPRDYIGNVRLSANRITVSVVGHMVGAIVIKK